MSRSHTTLDLSQFPTRPTQLLTASSGWSMVDMREVWQSRELLVSLAWRDVRARYKQTVLGAVWVVAQPLLAAGIFSFVFTIIAGLQTSTGVPYFLLTFAGLMAFNQFNQTLNRSGGALVGNAVLVSKIYFPRLVLPLATVFTVAVDFIVVLAMGLVLVGLFWHLPGWSLLLLPICTLLLWGLALGCGLLVAAIAVSYRDAIYVLPVVSQFLMWGSAVLFEVNKVPERYRDFFYLNPLVSLIEVFRFSLFGKGDVNWFAFGYAAMVTLVMLVIGAFAFRRMERRFADVI